MKPDEIFLDLAKLRDYVLASDHPRGRHKARVFYAALGIKSDQAAWLRDAIIEATELQYDQLQQIGSDIHGTRFSLDITVTISSRQAEIRTLWIAPAAHPQKLCFVSCYVVK